MEIKTPLKYYEPLGKQTFTKYYDPQQNITKTIRVNNDQKYYKNNIYRNNFISTRHDTGYI